MDILFVESTDFVRTLELCPATGAALVAEFDDDDDEEDAFPFAFRFSTGPGGSGAKSGSLRFGGLMRHSLSEGSDCSTCYAVP